VTRIDSHIHLFENGYGGDRPAGAELAGYQLLRRRHGIDKALVVGFEGDARFAGNNGYVLNLAKDQNWIFPLCYVDLANASPHSPDEFVAAGAAGFSLYLGSDATVAGRVQAEVWNAIDRHGLLVSVNAAPAALAGFGAVLEQLPASAVLISHLGLPGPAPVNRADDSRAQSQVSARMSALVQLAQYPQVSVKLSGLYAIDAGFPHALAQADVHAALEAFGVDRLVWGSDYSPGMDAVTAEELFAIPDWITSQLNAEELEKVAGGTLQRILDER
jgi:L-fuconolactonase